MTLLSTALLAATLPFQPLRDSVPQITPRIELGTTNTYREMANTLNDFWPDKNTKDFHLQVWLVLNLSWQWKSSHSASWDFGFVSWKDIHTRTRFITTRKNEKYRHEVTLTYNRNYTNNDSGYSQFGDNLVKSAWESGSITFNTWLNNKKVAVGLWIWAQVWTWIAKPVTKLQESTQSPIFLTSSFAIQVNSIFKILIQWEWRTYVINDLGRSVTDPYAWQLIWSNSYTINGKKRFLVDHANYKRYAIPVSLALVFTPHDTK